MEERKQHIDDLFRDELGGYREVPDPRVWSALEQRLDGGRNKKRIIIWWVSGLALLLAIAGSLITGNVLPGFKTPATVAGVKPTAPSAGITDAPEAQAVPTAHRTTPTPAATPATVAATVATPVPGTTVLPKGKTQEKQTRTLQNNRTLAATPQQPATVAATPATAVAIAPQPIATNNIPAQQPANSAPAQQNISVPKPTIADATPAAIIPAQNTAPVPASANRLTREMVDEMPLPLAGAPKAKPMVPQADISRYEPLITRSKNNGSNMIAAAGKQIAAPVANAAQHAETLAAPAPQAAAPNSNDAVNTPATTTAATPSATPGDTTAENSKPRNPIKWSYGLKTGYDLSMNKYSAGNALLGAYLQAHISKRMSVILQPTVKYTNMKRTTLDGTASYYDVKNSSVTALHIITPEGADAQGNPVYNIIRRYFYAQQYDSVVVTKTIRPKQYAEFELPLLLQYRLTKALSVTGGVSANFSRLVQAEREESRFKGMMRYDTAVFAKVNESSPAPAIPAIETRIKYNYSPYADYLAQQKADPVNNLRFNYMLGINYALRNGLSFDLLMLSLLGNANYINDNDIKKIYKTPYIRIGVTYKLSK
ncbi:MAG: hypothetical protein ACK4EY_07710 [Flavipsychrobacter sp.]